MKTSTRAVAYLRVSTDKQADGGVSLDAQRAKVEAYASLYDIEMVEVIVDAGESAKTLDRPGLQRALGMLKRREADALLVVKLDRLTRSVRDLGDLIEGAFAPGRAELLSVSEQIDTRSAGGRMVLTILATVSEWERRVIGERTSAALQHKRSIGEYTGGVAPYGHRLAVDGVHVLDVPEEQATLACVSKLRAAGYSLRRIAAELARAGVVNRSGRPFGPQSIAGMLVTPRT